MNLLITLAKAVAARLNADPSMGNVTVTEFPSGAVIIDVNGDVYSWNSEVGWMKPDIGDHAPKKYMRELRDRLINGAILGLGTPVAAATIPLPAPPVPAQQAPSVPAQQASKKSYRILPASAAPAFEGESCRRCKGSGKKGPGHIKKGLCFWCNGDKTQYAGWITRQPQA